MSLIRNLDDAEKFFNNKFYFADNNLSKQYRPRRHYSNYNLVPRIYVFVTHFQMHLAS